MVTIEVFEHGGALRMYALHMHAIIIFVKGWDVRLSIVSYCWNKARCYESLQSESLQRLKDSHCGLQQT